MDEGLDPPRDGVDSRPATPRARRLGEVALDAPCAEVSALSN